ncbi:MAG: DUF6353 family protein [Eubacteriales bacterium]|nr:DUF6353 family protein [Eubacteriales bacterium]
MRKRLYKIGKNLKRETPTILTILGTIGMAGTVIAAVKATPKACRDIQDAEDEKGDILTKSEKIFVAIPRYIPAAAIGAATLSCIWTANILSRKQQASLISAYVFLERAFKNYRNAAIKEFGKDSDLKIRSRTAFEKYEKGEVKAYSEKPLFYDMYSNRYFNLTMEEVRDAEYHLNRNFILRGHVDLNEFYDFLGLPRTDVGGRLGWSVEAGFDFYGYQWIDFEHDLISMEDGMECYIISMPFEPTADFLSY